MPHLESKILLWIFLWRWYLFESSFHAEASSLCLSGCTCTPTPRSQVSSCWSRWCRLRRWSSRTTSWISMATWVTLLGGKDLEKRRSATASIGDGETPGVELSISVRERREDWALCCAPAFALLRLGSRLSHPHWLAGLSLCAWKMPLIAGHLLGLGSSTGTLLPPDSTQVGRGVSRKDTTKRNMGLWNVPQQLLR